MNTGFPVIRPTIIEKLLDARSRLLEGLQRLQSLVPDVSADDKTLYLGEEEVRGFGRCVASVADCRGAIKHYTMTIQRYALHVSDDLCTSSRPLSVLLNSVSLTCQLVST